MNPTWKVTFQTPGSPGLHFSYVQRYTSAVAREYILELHPGARILKIERWT